MKIGHIIDGLEVIDVKRVNKMNLVQFTKAVSELLEQGYKLDVHSSRQIGLVLMVDMYKLESGVSVGSTEESVKEPNETTIKAIQESTEKLETVETIDEVIEEALVDLKESDTETEEGEQTAPPVKKTRAKKTT